MSKINVKVRKLGKSHGIDKIICFLSIFVKKVIILIIFSENFIFLSIFWCFWWKNHFLSEKITFWWKNHFSGGKVTFWCFWHFGRGTPPLFWLYESLERIQNLVFWSYQKLEITFSTPILDVGPSVWPPRPI